MDLINSPASVRDSICVRVLAEDSYRVRMVREYVRTGAALGMVVAMVGVGVVGTTS